MLWDQFISDLAGGGLMCSHSRKPDRFKQSVNSLFSLAELLGKKSILKMKYIVRIWLTDILMHYWALYES